ncbi:MAG: DUF695 domain-containing protein [Zoogloeaceae bacterium]|jgi:hypothetical protein|nr:DUF695 domain-containing protein [Zoogloeaceae bacterium]
MKNTQETKGFVRQKEELALACREFWLYFRQHAPEFFAVINQNRRDAPADVDEKFFQKIAPLLEKISDGFFFLAGKYDEHTAELILTAEGNLKIFALIETLVAAAPALENWKITALKPPIDIENCCILMGDQRFDKDNISFYLEENPEYPEEINLVVIHADLDEDNRKEITLGCDVFLDNYLGERYFATAIDNLRIEDKAEATHEPLPVDKLQGYLLTQQTRFAANITDTDSMDADAIDPEHYRYSLLEIRRNDAPHDDDASAGSEKVIVALVNDTLLNLNAGALYPWIAVLILPYASHNESGMPDEKTQQLFERVEEDLLAELPPDSGCLYIIRETGDSERALYFACRDFREISQTCYYAQQKYAEAFKLDCELYKDRYWRTFQRFTHD